MRRGILLAACVLAAACGGDGPIDRPPHIVLITSDTLRADHLSLNGYPRPTSPSIDAFAAAATHYTDAVTVIPKTGPAFATMFTGRHPQEHGVRSNFEAVPASLSVLAEILKVRGYRTAAFVGNPALRPTKGFARGFDLFELFDGRRGEGVLAVNEAFREWAHGEWDRPSFVWVHYMDPHGPYTPPEELLAPFLKDDLASSDRRIPIEAVSAPDENPNKVLGTIPDYQRLGSENRVAVYIARYDAEILHMDAAFGRLIDFLRERGLYDDSAIVFTSDHGESLGEHDFWFEHGWFAHEPGLRIPLIVKQPGQTEGRKVNRQVSILDLLPTLLAIAMADGPSEVVGRDLKGALDAAAPVLIENSDRYPVKYLGVRASGWKYLVPSGDGAEELYDLRADPGETRNLAGSEPERLATMRATFETLLGRARASALPQTTGIPDDPATLERLRALGYID